MTGESSHTAASISRIIQSMNRLNCLSLRLGDWKTSFSDLQCKLMLAKGLNYCIEEDNMAIAGYLMTEKNLFLILRPCETDRDQLVLLDEFLKVEIASGLRWRQSLKGNAQNYDQEIKKILAAPLWTIAPLVNHDLIQLLCGVYGPDAHQTAAWERLKDLSWNNNFCSVGNYADESLIGPVLVDIDWEWEEE